MKVSDTPGDVFWPLLAALVLVPIGLVGEDTGEGRWTAHPINVWVKQSPRPGVATPPLKYEGSGALDPATGQWIHFGGHDGIPQGFLLFTCDLETGVWRQRFPNTSPPGVCCVDGSNTFDVVNRAFVAFPGASLGHGYQWSRSVKLKKSGVWLYDPVENVWTAMRPPPYEQPEKYSRDILGSLNSCATYDPDHEVAISFGGQGAGGPVNALFVYDACTNRLEQLRPPGPPSRRDGAGLCYDSWRDRLVMFGSQYSDDEQTWTYRFDENRWEAHALDPHPPARKEGTYSTNPKMAFDSRNGVCLCVVRRGEQSGNPTGTLETWVLDFAKMEWAEMKPATCPAPSASRARNLSYWPEQNVFVLESIAADKSGPQLWTYRYRRAPPDDRPGPPAGLEIVTAKGEVRLSWDPGEATEFRVYRAEDRRHGERRFERVASTKRASFRDTGLSNDKVFLYRVTAVGQRGVDSRPSRIARAQPRVPRQPVVSVLAADRIKVSWQALPEDDVAGYNLYRGLATVDAVRRGTPAAWRDNDPEYAEPVVVNVRNIKNLQKRNEKLLAVTEFSDTEVNVAEKGLSSQDYRYAVYAYIVRAVNRLGVESGPSPYALTIPSAPEHVLLRERDEGAEIKWRANPETDIAGYRLYKLGKSHWDIMRVNEQPISSNTFLHSPGKASTRYWVVAVDALGQEGEPSSPVWYRHSYENFYDGEWHQ